MSNVATIDVPTVEEAIGVPAARWATRCHEISLAMVRTMFAPGEARVARGWCDGVFGQHSWVVVGDDCYDTRATIIDPTLWSYTGKQPYIWRGTLGDGLHHPHGSGSIWTYGRPDYPSGAPMKLTPRKPWSRYAKDFLTMLGPLDKQGWIQLAHAPVEEWPAAEIIDAMCESGLEGYVPIDIVGMLTDRNPGNLYLNAGEETSDGVHA